MAAIDRALSHLLGYEDVMISSRNIYGGVHQLIHDWYAKPSNLDIGARQFDGYTAFWNVYYINGAFLSSDEAYEILQGMRTLELRMLRKCISTEILAKFRDAHEGIQVSCNALAKDKNSVLRKTRMNLDCENPKDLIWHFISAAQLAIDPVHPGYSSLFLREADIDRLITETYMKYHQQHVEQSIRAVRSHDLRPAPGDVEMTATQN